MLSQIPQTLSSANTVQWQRFVQACENFDPKTLRLCQDRQELPSVWVCSTFVAEACIADPSLLYSLINRGELDRKYHPHELKDDLDQWLEGVEDEIELHFRLRQFRKKQMIRIAWRDLAGWADLSEVLQFLSELAEACIQQALVFHTQWLQMRQGVVLDEQGRLLSMVVIALGKLGGGELNFSSDVDLILAYGSGRKSADPTLQKSTLDAQTYFTRLGRKIVSALDTLTAQGRVFRTDLRLRPHGESGPIVLSLSAIEYYYQTHGRDWERYALIKARMIAGDTWLGQDLQSLLKPFIYRKYLDFGAFDAIREMKQMIQQELKRKGRGQDIKLGWGGIREIEFFVQSYQLILGGRDKYLQTASLYDAYNRLVEIGVLNTHEHEIIIQAYVFLRNCEHRLQMYADQQIHQLPEKSEYQQRLAFSMGCESWQQLVGQMNQHRNHVDRLFQTILKEKDRANVEPVSRNYIAIWQELMDESDVIAFLKSSGFDQADSLVHLLRGFRQSRLYQAYANVEKDRVDKLIPMALAKATEIKEPYRAMVSFVTILEGIGRRTSYFSLLIENPIALKQLLQLCAASPLITSQMGQHPVILGELLHPIVDIRQQTKQDIVVALASRLRQIEQSDEEARINATREFQHAEILKIAAADIAGKLQIDDIHLAITYLAEVLLQAVFNDALAYVEQKLGPAPCQAGIIAYGKLASSELGYLSDLDLVVCYDYEDNHDKNQRSEDYANIEYYFSRVGRRLIHLLTTRTQTGRLYALDMRLRPSGNSGTLVVSLASFFDYQIKQAWTWEHQALVRSRVVVGSSQFSKKFELARKAILSLVRDNASLRADVIQMREKMISANCKSNDQWFDIKLDMGGIVDIEFLVQYWVLTYANQTIKLVEPRTTNDIMDSLSQEQAVDSRVIQQLKTIYQSYLKVSLILKLMDKPVLVAQSRFKPEREQVKNIWQAVFFGDDPSIKNRKN